MERSEATQSREPSASSAPSTSVSTSSHNPFDPSNLLGHPSYNSMPSSMYSPLAHPAAFSMLAAGRAPMFPAMPFMPTGLEGYGINPFAAQLQAAAMFGIPPPPGYAEALYSQAKLLQDAAEKSQSTASPSKSSREKTPSKSSHHGNHHGSHSNQVKKDHAEKTKAVSHSIANLSKSSHSTSSAARVTSVSDRHGDRRHDNGDSVAKVTSAATDLTIPKPTKKKDDKNESDSDVSSASAPVDTPSEDSDENNDNRKKDNQPSDKHSTSTPTKNSDRPLDQHLLNSPLSITDLVRQQKLAGFDPSFMTSLMTSSGHDVARSEFNFSTGESAFMVPGERKKPGRKPGKRPMDPELKEHLRLQRRFEKAQNNGELKVKKKGRPKTISDDNEPSWSANLLEGSPTMVKKTVPTMVSLVVPNFKQQPVFPGMSSSVVDLPPPSQAHPSTSGHSESEGVSDHDAMDVSIGEDGKAIKRGRFEYDMKELNMPLDRGWRREVRISGMGKRGIVGDVFYFAPCGKKMKTFPDVTRYLDKSRTKDMTKHNFTFSTKLNIGEFFEIKSGDGDKWSRLTGDEVDSKLEQTKRKKLSKKGPKKRDLGVELNLKRRLEEQDLLAEELIQEKLKERQMRANLKKQLHHESAQARKKAKEREKLMRSQEKHQRQEQSRMERELRAQQLMEEKQRRREEQEAIRLAEVVKKTEILQERELKRQQTILIKEQDREHRRQMLVLSNMERERRRQHMLLVKALECRKRQEERDKQREEKINEKRMSKKQLEHQSKVKDLNQPVEDMCLKDQTLPDLKRVEGVNIAGAALADCLMVVEFLNNFKESLGLAEEGLPTLDSLQRSLLNEHDYVDELMGLTCHLLKLCVEDPGFPNPKEQAVTTYGQKLIDIALDDDNMSEVMRIFITGRNGKDDPMAKWLVEKPFLALNVTKKAAVLGFMCNELLCSKNVQAEMDQNIETISNLRRDKWVVEGKLRKLRVIENRFPAGASKVTPNGEESTQASTKRNGGGGGGAGGSEDEDDSGNESEADMENQMVAEEDDPEPQTADECDKFIDKLQKQHHAIRGKVFEAGHKLRGMSFGNDRYERRYWVLPHAGGLYAEGRESAEGEHVVQHPFEEDEPPHEFKPSKREAEFDKDDDIPLKQLVENESEVKTESVVKTESEIKTECKTENESVDRVDGESKISSSDTLVSEKDYKPLENGISDSDDDESVDNQDSGSESLKLAPKKMDFQMACGVENKKMDFEMACGKEGENGGQIVEGEDRLVLDLKGGKDEQQAMETESHDSGLDLSKPSSVTTETRSTDTTTNCNKEVKIELKEEVKTEPLVNGHVGSNSKSFMSIDSLLDKKPEANTFLPFLDNAQGLTAEQMLRNLSERQLQKPWFSVLPRMPCDEKSITRTHSLTRQQGMFLPVQYSPVSQSVYTGMGAISSAYDPYTQFFSPLKMQNSDSPCSTPGFSQSPMPQEEKPEPIPEDLQRGWWLVSEVEEFREILKSLHPRGIREKILQRNLQKYSEYITESFEKAKSDFLGLRSNKTETEDADEETEDSVEKEQNEKEEQPQKAEVVEEKAEEKVDVKVDVKIDVKVDVKVDVKTEKAGKFSSPDPDPYGAYNHTVMAETYSQLLEEMENLETRVYQASLQVKGWKVPPSCASPAQLQEAGTGEKVFAIEQTRERLTSLERNIERRYLKYPLNKRIQTSTSNILAYVAPNGQNASPREQCKQPVEEEPESGIIAAGLINWRNGVASATNCSQLHLCIAQLAHCICWEKSIMKVICQLCQQDDNEAQLLLCDGCDKGFHTYCFKPKMEGIPEGEWYCFDCVSKATGYPHCVVCGQKTAKMVTCCQCNRHYHPDCVDPPVQRCPRKFWCVACDNNKQRIAWRNRKRRSLSLQHEKKVLSPKVAKTSAAAASVAVVAAPYVESSKVMMDTSNVDSDSPVESNKKKSPEKEVVVESCDLTPCRTLISELEKHDKAWPFLKPVNSKQIPQYRKIIKHPMDFQTMKNRLNNSHYKSRDDFVADALLVFDNCETFNEDLSEVGQAGHEMRKFFLKRWAQLSENS